MVASLLVAVAAEQVELLRAERPEAGPAGDPAATRLLLAARYPALAALAVELVAAARAALLLVARPVVLRATQQVAQAEAAAVSAVLLRAEPLAVVRTALPQAAEPVVQRAEQAQGPPLAELAAVDLALLRRAARPVA